MKHVLACLLLLLGVAACSDGDSMRRQLQELQARNQADSLMTDLNQATTLCDYFDRHGTPNERMLAHYLLGRTHADLGEAPEALQAFHDAADCADTTASDCDYRQLARVHGQKASLFYSQELFHNALESFLLAESFARNGQEEATAANYISQQAKCYFHLGEMQKAISASEDAANCFYELGDTLSGNTCLGLVAYYYIEKGELAKGRKNLLKYENHSWVTEESKQYNESWKLVYYYKGLYYLKAGQLDSSLHYFNKELEISSDPNNRTLAYKGLYQTYEALGDATHSSYYAIRYAESNDSTSRLSLASALLSLDRIYDYVRFREVSNRKTIEVKNLRLRMVYHVSVASVIVLLLVFAYFRQLNKKKMLRQRMNAKYATDMLMFTKICSDLEHQQSEDAAKRKALETELSALRRSLTEAQEDQRAPEKWGISMKILDTPIVKHFHQMASQGKTVSDDKWQELRSLCNLSMPHFMEKLYNTDYSPNLVETQICILIKLRFLMSEIGILLQLSPSALSKKRTRLLKKMFGTDGTTSVFDEKIRFLEF